MTTPTRPPHDRTSTPPSEPAAWTVARAFAESTRRARLAALICSVALVAPTAASDVPLATAVTLAALLPAVLVDIIDRRLPNRLVGGAALVGGSTAFVTRLLDVDIWFGGAMLGAAAMATPLLVAHLIAPPSMGFGDVKLGVVIGAALGLTSPTLAFLALALGSLVAAIHGLATRQRSIAFGPALLVAGVSVLCINAVDMSGVPGAAATYAVERTF